VQNSARAVSRQHAPGDHGEASTLAGLDVGGRGSVVVKDMCCSASQCSACVQLSAKDKSQDAQESGVGRTRTLPGASALRETDAHRGRPKLVLSVDDDPINQVVVENLLESSFEVAFFSFSRCVQP